MALAEDQPKHAALKNFAHLRSLEDGLVTKIEVMLIKGISPSKITKTIHTEWGLLTEVSVAALTKQIQRYKKAVLDHKLKTNLIIDGKPAVATLALDTPKAKVDVFEEVQELIRTQTDRLRKVLLVEKNMPMLMGSVRFEIECLAKLHRQFTDLQFDLGQLTRVPKSIRGRIDLTALHDSPQEKDVITSLSDRDLQAEVTQEVFEILDQMMRDELGVDQNAIHLD